MTNVANRVSILDSAVQELVSRIEQATNKVERRLGTTEPPPVNALEQRVAQLEALVRELSGAPAPRQRAARGTLAPEVEAAPVPPRRRAMRVTFVGDDGPTTELIDAVETLLRAREMTTDEIVAATGARRNRVSGALVRLGQRVKLVNKGNARRAIWSIG